MLKRSQTATEYLIILAVVIIIGLVVVAVLGGIPGIGGGTGARTAQTQLLSQNIGVTSYAVTPTGSVIDVRNNQPRTVRLVNITADGIGCGIFGPSIILRSGETRSVTCPDINATAGAQYEFEFEIIYTDSFGVQYTQGGVPLVGTASSEGLGESPSGPGSPSGPVSFTLSGGTFQDTTTGVDSQEQGGITINMNFKVKIE